MKHKSEIASSFHFLPGHLKYASIFEKMGLKQFEVLTNGKEMGRKHW